MSLILVVEREARHIERIEDALTSEGWRVRTVGDRQEAAAAAAEEAPDLVLVSSSQPDARELLESYGRNGGGPGSIVLLAEAEVGMPVPEAFGADDLVSKPFTAKELRMVVRRCLARSSGPPVAASSSGESKLTSSDIFGDLLDEVEGHPSTLVPPPPRSDSEIDRKIEETLSGVLDVHRERSASRAASAKERSEEKKAAEHRKSESAVDQLLSDTLSGLDLGSKKPRRSTTPSVAPDSTPPSASPASPPSPPHPTAPVSSPAPLSESPEPAAAPPREETSSALSEAPTESPTSAPAEEEAAPPTVPEAAVPSTPVSAETTPPPAEPVVAKPKKVAATSDALEGLESLYATQRIPIEKKPNIGKEPEAGEEFGQYTLEERIARGGMAEVWRAKMKGVEGFQKRVAIKRILPHLTDSGDFVDMFIDEAKLAAQLNHSNIIHIYDLGKIGDDYYIAMEYVEGKDLRSILNRARAVDRPMPHALALLIASRLAGALDYAHRKRDFDNRDLGLVHRDVSPQNVLISNEGDIKLCDFGIAKAVSKVSKTQMGALKGKLQYMSPEQARGKKVDARTDIFSLGAVLFEMLTGRRLFPGDSEISVLEAVREGRVVDPRELDSTIPPEVNACVAKALAKDPDDRYQTAGELQSELNRLLQKMQPGTGSSDLARYVQDVFSIEALKSDQKEAADHGEKEGGKDEARDEGQQEFPPLAPPPGAAPEEAETHGRGLLFAAIAALIVLIVAAVFVVRYRLKSGKAAPSAVAEAARPPEAGAGQPEAQPGAMAPTPVTSQPVTKEGTDVGKPAAGGTVATKPKVASGESGAAKGKGGAALPPAEVQKLVSQEVQRREEALRKKFEERQKKLQEELAKTQAEQHQPKAVGKTPAAASGAKKPAVKDKNPAAAKTEVTQVAQETAKKGSPAQQATQEPPRAKQEPPVAPVSNATATSQPNGGEPATNQRSAPASSQSQAAAAQPETTKPAAVEPSTVSQPPKPSVKLGELVAMGPGVTPPQLLRFVKPPYPPIAQKFKVQGTVILSLLVDENGRVDNVKVLRGVEEKVGINEAAISAAKKARFKPATKDGVRVKMWFTLTVPFQL